jgi:hypothetical protein
MTTATTLKLSAFEKELLDLVGTMVEQHCRSRVFREDGSWTPAQHENQYDSGFIRVHKEAMQMLVQYGLMECLYPEQEDSVFRDYDAKFVDNWRWKLWRQL